MARKLIVTIGVPAIGKSTWLKSQRLNKYVLETDALRPLVSEPQSRVNNLSTEDGINFDAEGATWGLLDDLIEQRMKKGQTVIVDATHLFKGSLSRYKDLLKHYQYQMIAIDFMKDFITEYPTKEMALHELWHRDLNRGGKVSTQVQEKYYDRYINAIDSLHNNYRIMTPDEFRAQYLSIPEPVDLSEYDDIKIVGDIHGDLSSLKKVFDTHHKGTAYIFVGDYLDRGSKNTATFQFLQSLKGKNLFFLRGNHEDRMGQFVYNREQHGQFGKHTLEELLKNGVTPKELETFLGRTQDYLYFTYGENKYFVSHAGLEPASVTNYMKDVVRVPYEAGSIDDTQKLPSGPMRYLALEAETTFTNGLDTIDNPKHTLTPYQVNVDANYEEQPYIPFIQVHGHRNEFHVPINQYTNTYNLTEEGRFRYLELSLNADNSVETTTYDSPRIDTTTFIQSVELDSDIQTRDLGDGLKSHNFTREVFYRGRWTPKTMSARGLFSKDGKVVGRGFKKFFNVGENEEASLDNLVYPVNIYNKWNGYLAIAFCLEGEVKVETKSGMGYTDHSHSEDTLATAQRLVERENNLQGYYDNDAPNRDNYSVLFEVLAPWEGDTHIIKYDKDATKALAVIDNTTGQFVTEDEETCWGITPMYVAHNRAELDEFITIEMQHQDEGIVLRDVNGFQLKMKTPFYLKAKELRGAIEGSSPKKHWYYGAENWYQETASQKIHQFTPQLALDLATPSEDE